MLMQVPRSIPKAIGNQKSRIARGGRPLHPASTTGGARVMIGRQIMPFVIFIAVLARPKYFGISGPFFSVARSSPVVPAIPSKRVTRLLENRHDAQENTPLSDTRRSCRSLLLRQNHFHHLALRSTLLAADSVGVDIHGVAVGMAHVRAHVESLRP